jgi:hypothetical protein
MGRPYMLLAAAIHNITINIINYNSLLHLAHNKPLPELLTSLVTNPISRT